MSIAREISREENRIPLKTDAFGSQTKVSCAARCTVKLLSSRPQDQDADTPTESIIIFLKARKVAISVFKSISRPSNLHANSAQKYNL